MSADNRKLFEMVERMPTFSQSVVRILQLTSTGDAAPKELVRLVEHDPILTMKVLKLVNSAYFGLGRQVTSIKQGVVYIGVNTIKHLAISIAAIGARRIVAEHRARHLVFVIDLGHRHDIAVPREKRRKPTDRVGDLIDFRKQQQPRITPLRHRAEPVRPHHPAIRRRQIVVLVRSEDHIVSPVRRWHTMSS